MVVVISSEPLVGCCSLLQLLDSGLDGCSCFLEAVGHDGNVHAKSTKNDTQKNGFGP